MYITLYCSLREWAQTSNLQFKLFRNLSMDSEGNFIIHFMTSIHCILNELHSLFIKSGFQGGLICLQSLALEKGKVIKPANAALVEKLKVSAEVKKPGIY